MSDRDNQAYYSLVRRKDSTGDFYFLRRQSVDVMRYLPRFLAKDPEFLKIQNALSWEHENLRLRLMDISRQFYIETATWGLSSWERIYEVTPPPGAGYELRRALVKAKMLGAGVMTVEAIKPLVNPFLHRPDAEIDELPTPGTFWVVIPSGTDHMGEIRHALAEMSPAHLIYKFRFAIRDLYDDESVNLGDALTASLRLGYEDIYPYEPFPIGRDGSILHGGALRRSGLFRHDGTLFRNGVLPGYSLRGGKGVHIDALALSLGAALFDDVSAFNGDPLRDGFFTHDGFLVRDGVIYRDGRYSYDGTALHDGILRHTLTLPLERLSDVAVRSVLTDKVQTVSDDVLSSMTVRLYDAVPYGSKVPMLLHDGSIARGNTFHRDGTVLYNGEILHDGNALGAYARRGKSDLEMDEYHAVARLSLFDDVSVFLAERNGTPSHDGLYQHGRNVTPSECEHRVYIRQCLSDALQSVNDNGLMARLQAVLSDIVPYGTRPVPEHDGKGERSGTSHRSGAFRYDGELRHTGTISTARARGGKGDLLMDEYAAGVHTIFEDDASREFLPRNGGQARDGDIVHGENPLPRDLSQGFSVQYSLTDAAKSVDKGGEMAIAITTLRHGGLRRDGRAERGIAAYTDTLDGALSIQRIGRGGNYARDGDMARSHDTLAVAI